MSDFPAVTIVILNWNGRHWLAEFLPSVLASTYPAMEVLVVDNASTDDSLAWLKAHHPEVRTLVLDQNYGFAEGNNRALPHVHTPYLVLLNSDVEVPAGWLEPLVATMEAHPRCIALQPRILAHHDKQVFEYAGAAGGFLDVLGYPFCRGRIFDTVERDEGQHQTALPVAWATGACLMLRREALAETGLFDPTFFAHMEEID
ncbi:MAG: glycosyltransferase family 2 protein, partial [Bacteroidetes bacterium]